MPSPDSLIAILERILAGDRNEAEIAQLRQGLKMRGNGLQYVSQDGKFNANIGQVQESEIHIGDRTFIGDDANAIKQVLYECGLIKDRLPGFQKVECEVPETIYPVLIHSKHQQLVEKIIFHEWIRFSELPPKTGLRLPGLVNQTWSFCNLNHEKTNESLIINTPTNPPVIVTSNDLGREFTIAGNLEIFVDSRRVWRQEIALQPVVATPKDIKLVDALAAFVFPADPLVIDLVRQARGRVEDSQPRLAFANANSIEAAQVLYQQIRQSRPRRNDWESAPWNPGEVVRLPRQVLEQGEARCLDLALLFCSVIEHIRRLPVLVGVKVNDSQWQVMVGIRVNDENVNSSALCLDFKEIKESCHPNRTYLFAMEALIDGKSSVEANHSAQEQLAKVKEAFLVDVQAARNAGVWSFPISEPLRIQPDFSFRQEESQIHVEPSIGLPSELAEAVAKGRAVFLLGDVLDPKIAVSRQEFARIMSQKAELQETDLLYAGSVIEQRSNHEKLVQEAISALASIASQPTTPYQHLIQLSVKTIVSFHPDRVLEELLQNQNPPFRMLIDDEDLAALQPQQGSQELYLLGGSALTGKGLLLTHRDHHHLIHGIDVMARGLRDRLALQTLVVLGCDLSDLNLKELYLEATKHLSKGLRTIFLVGCSHVDQWLEKKPCKVLEQSPQEFLEVLTNIVPSVSRPIEVAITQSKSKQEQRLPYKYLDYFEAEDADLFFGREADLEQISREIWASPSRILVLCGRSGVGKTSLIKAGLIPRLSRAVDALAVYTRFGRDPEQSIIDTLRTHLEIERKGEVNSSSDLKQMLKELCRQCQGEIVIFMDQSEEAFIKLGHQFLQQFFCLVRELVSDPELSIRFVFVLREDYLGRLAKYQSQIPRLLETVYRLQELTREAAREAVIKPAQKCQLKVEEVLIEEILDDLSPDRILPAHLQIVCHRLYQECRGRELTVVLYEQVGRADYILKQYLEEAIKRLPNDIELVAKRVLRSLVTSERTKDLLSLEQIVKRIGLAEEQVAQAVNDLIHDQRLLREVDGNPIRFEFSHESLVDSVAEWLEARDLRIREIQEMLDQEVSNAKKLQSFEFPFDKLSLIDENRQHLELNTESVIVISQAFNSKGKLSNFWKAKLNGFEVEEYYAYYLGKSSIRSREDLIDALLKANNLFGSRQVERIFSKEMIELISKTLPNAPIEIISALASFALLDSSREAELIVFLGLEDASNESSERILNEWKDSEKDVLQTFQLIQERNELVSCKIISKVISRFWDTVSSKDWFSLLIKLIDKELLYDCDDIVVNVTQIECSSLLEDDREKLIYSVINGKEDFIDILLRIAFQEISGQTLTFLLKNLKGASDNRTEVIYYKILETELIYRRLKNIDIEEYFSILINFLENKKPLPKRNSIVDTNRKLFTIFGNFAFDIFQSVLKKKYDNDCQKISDVLITMHLHHCTAGLKSILKFDNIEHLYNKSMPSIGNEPKVIQVLFRLLRRRKSKIIDGCLRKNCLDLIKRVDSSACANGIILALVDHPKVSPDVRDAIFSVLHSMLQIWLKDQPSILKSLVIVGSKLKKKDAREFKQMILGCLPVIQVEAVANEKFSKREKFFLDNIFQKLDEVN